MYKLLYTLTLSLFISQISFGQGLDSLKRKIYEKGIVDTTRALCYIKIASQLDNTDSISFYAQKGLDIAKNINFDNAIGRAGIELGYVHRIKGNNDLAITTYKEAIIHSEKAQDWSSVGLLYSNIGIVFKSIGEYDSTIFYYEKSLLVREKQGDTEGLADIYNNFGVVYRGRGDYKRALDYYFLSLEMQEKLNNKIGVARSFNNIGNVYFYQEDYRKALAYYEKSLVIKKELNAQKSITYSYNNMGNCYQMLKEYDKAAEILYKSLHLAKEIKNNGRVLSAYGAFSDLYITILEVDAVNSAAKDSAKYYLEKGIALAQKLGAKERYVDFTVLFAAYHNATNQHEKALKYGMEASSLARKTGNNVDLRDALHETYLAADHLRKTDLAYRNYKQYIALRDSISNEDNLKKALNQEFKYKEEKIRLEQEKAEFAHQAELSEQRFIRNALVGGFGFVLILSFVVYRSYRIKKKDNALLEDQKREISTANEELRQQQEELVMLNENLEVQKKTVEETYDKLHFTSEQLEKSLTYASDIQQIIIPRPQRLEGFFEDTFSIFLPKDVVSGDFYWFSKLNEKEAVFVLADCTGHGVPGAFMSMLGSALLHETINVKGVKQDPARILRNLNAGLRKILRQQEGRNNDGMDVSVCCFERQESDTILTFCGAKSKAWLAAPNEDLLELKGDRISIGGKKTEKEFKNQQYNLCPETIVYLSTDGYIDQSNPQRKRLGSRTFKTLLQENREKPFAAQKEILLQTLKDHQQDAEQRDDISVVGLKIM